MRSKPHFDILNRFGVAHECDGRTERETDGIPNCDGKMRASDDAR